MKPESIAIAPMPEADAALREDLRALRVDHAPFLVQFLLCLHAAAGRAPPRAVLGLRVLPFHRRYRRRRKSIGHPAELLARWREELERVFNGSPTHPISRALADNVRRFAIPRRYFEEMIDGVEMDLGRTRYATFDELRLYCYRVASAVGLVCIEIFGYRNPRTREYAENLGIAFQLTNIIRDVSEDAARGRIYLPLEDLARFGVTEEEILRGARHAGASPPDGVRGRARTLVLRAGRTGAAAEDRAAMVCAEAMRSSIARCSSGSSARAMACSTGAIDCPPRASSTWSAARGPARGCGRGARAAMADARDVVVIGGGFAGLSAGVALAERGFRVAVLEGKPALGGRAYSFIDPESGDFVDNGQHVLMGCYAETIEFLDRIGQSGKLVFQRESRDRDDRARRRARGVLKTARLPGPLHMTAALMRYGTAEDPRAAERDGGADCGCSRCAAGTTRAGRAMSRR